MDKNNSTLKNNAEQHRILNEQIKAQGARVKELAEWSSSPLTNTAKRTPKR